MFDPDGCVGHTRHVRTIIQYVVRAEESTFFHMVVLGMPNSKWFFSVATAGTMEVYGFADLSTAIGAVKIISCISDFLSRYELLVCCIYN